MNPLSLSVDTFPSYEQSGQRHLEDDAAAFRALYDIALALNQQLQLPALVQTIVESAATLLGAAEATLYRPLPDGSALEVWASTTPQYHGLRLATGEGVAGQVFATGVPLSVPDYHTWEGRVEVYADEPLSAVAAAPLLWQGETLAVLDVFRFRDNPAPFTDTDRQRLNLLAAQAATALANARLLAETMQHARQQQTLQQLASAMIRPLELPALLETVLDVVLNYVEGLESQVGIFLLDEQDEKLHLAAYRGPSADRTCLNQSIAMGECLCGLAAQQDKVIVAGGDDPRHTYPCEWRSHAHIIAPLRAAAGGRVLGILFLYLSPSTQPDNSLVSLLDLVGKKVGIAVENAQLYMASQHHAEKLVRLADAVVEFASASTLSDTLAHVATAARELLDADRGAIFLLDREAGELSCAHAAGLSEEYVSLINTIYRQVPGNRVLQTFTPVHITDAQTDPASVMLHEAAAQEGFHTYAAWPMIRKGTPVGAFALYRDTVRPFTNDELSLGQTMAQQAAGIIENARLYEQVQEQMYALKEAQDRLVEAEKLAVVGQLVSGIAHEINNPLTAVLGYSDLLTRENLSASAHAKLQHIVDQSERIAKIVSHLVQFVSPPPAKRVSLSINDLLKASVALLEDDLQTQHITVTWDLAKSLPDIRVAPTQMQTVFLNMINNARQAMYEAHGSGNLTLRTTLRSGDGGKPAAILIEITDDGPGIPHSVLSRIFDPFFTTKEVGQGTGLGLSVCYGIVQEHEGRITVQSPVPTTEGEVAGTRFIIELPVR